MLADKHFLKKINNQTIKISGHHTRYLQDVAKLLHK